MSPLMSAGNPSFKASTSMRGASFQSYRNLLPPMFGMVKSYALPIGAPLPEVLQRAQSICAPFGPAVASYQSTPQMCRPGNASRPCSDNERRAWKYRDSKRL